VDAPYAFLELLEPGIGRLLARNPSPYTYTGTQTYFAGAGDELVVIDPGPDIPEHVDAIVAAAGERRIVAIACTHTHRDHSPAAKPLAAATGAPIIGCAALALESVGPRADASFDGDYAPDKVLADGESIDFGDGEQLVAVATPGLLRLSRRAVHRRSRDGLVDHRGGPARWRHGAVHGQPAPLA